MHTRAKLLSACITLLIASANALPTSREVNSKLIFSKSNENQDISTDILENNNFISFECHFSVGHLQGNCDISGLPADETTLQRCNNLTINASHSDSVHVRVKSVHRFRDNKLLVNVIEEVRNQRDLTTLHIFDNCLPVNVVSFVDSKDGSVVDLQKVIIYEDGFDVIKPDSTDEIATLHYHSFDSDGKHIGNYTVLPELLPPRNPKTLVSLAKRHSRGFSFPSGYHFYPNGSIIRFADDQYKSLMGFNSIKSSPDDGPFYTACTSIPTRRNLNNVDDVDCRQYDVDNARLALKVQFRPTGTWPIMTSLRNLSKGGFLAAMGSFSTMTVYVFRPDRPTFVDSIDFGPNTSILSRNLFIISDFDETTGKITVFWTTLGSPQTYRSSYFLQNYTST